MSEHVERRPGQRWRRTNRGGSSAHGTLTERYLSAYGGWSLERDDEHGYCGWSDESWTNGQWTYELLSDAPSPAPPAQEAPKAATVCVMAGMAAHPKCSGPVLPRSARFGILLVCEAGMLQNEAEVAKKTKSSGTPYAGPERLPPKPMAHVAGLDDSELVTW